MNEVVKKWNQIRVNMLTPDNVYTAAYFHKALEKLIAEHRENFEVHALQGALINEMVKSYFQLALDEESLTPNWQESLEMLTLFLNASIASVKEVFNE